MQDYWNQWTELWACLETYHLKDQTMLLDLCMLRDFEMIIKLNLMCFHSTYQILLNSVLLILMGMFWTILNNVEAIRQHGSKLKMTFIGALIVKALVMVIIIIQLILTHSQNIWTYIPFLTLELLLLCFLCHIGFLLHKYLVKLQNFQIIQFKMVSLCLNVMKYTNYLTCI